MGLFDRVEGKLERAYNGIFARAFRAEVQPVEIASAIRRAMDDKAAAVGKGVALVPNVFTIELSETDYERLGEAAHARAARTHDADANLADLLAAYRDILAAEPAR